MPPQFTQPLHNAAATEGQMVRLQCRVLGRPRPQIEWFKDGVPLTSTPNYTIRSDGDSHWIEFSDIYLNDHGEYTCMATNPVGVAKTSCRMDVERRPIKRNFAFPFHPINYPTTFVKL